jgi:nitroreductase
MKRRTVLVSGGAALVAAGGAVAAGVMATGSTTAYANATTTMRASVGPGAQVRDLVRAATLAANGHNTQPWRFRLSDRAIEITPDFSRRTPVVDPDDHHLYVSLGCAAENLLIAAEAAGKPGDVHLDPAGNGRIVFEFSEAAPQRMPLFDAVQRRQSTRAGFDGRSVGSADLRVLETAGRAPGVDLILVTERAQIGRLRDLVVAGNSVQMGDVAFMAELKHWLRFNPRDALASGDGLYAAASGNPVMPRWLGRLMFDLFFTVAAENDKYARHIDSSAGIAVFAAERDDPEHWMRAGRACQRFWLQATALGLKLAVINQPIEVKRLRPELAALIGLPSRRPNMVLRFGYGPLLPMSPRRPVEAVIDV